jgi:hypothetical protein
MPGIRSIFSHPAIFMGLKAKEERGKSRKTASLKINPALTPLVKTKNYLNYQPMVR